MVMTIGRLRFIQVINLYNMYVALELVLFEQHLNENGGNLHAWKLCVFGEIKSINTTDCS